MRHTKLRDASCRALFAWSFTYKFKMDSMWMSQNRQYTVDNMCLKFNTIHSYNAVLCLCWITLTHSDRCKMATIYQTTYIQMHFLEWNCCILMKISLKCFPQCPINNIPALIPIMAWCQSGIYAPLGLSGLISYNFSLSDILSYENRYVWGHVHICILCIHACLYTRMLLPSVTTPLAPFITVD